MAILLILLILVLGYRYTNAIPAEKIALKRSSGWEAYVRMGSHGIRFVHYAYTNDNSAFTPSLGGRRLRPPKVKPLFSLKSCPNTPK